MALVATERCEQDYVDAQGHLDAIRLQHEDVHRAQWEAHQRAAEVAQLQKELADAKLNLFEEKRNVLNLLAETDNLKVQELKDRKKIRYLLNAGDRGEESETTYFRDRLDKRVVRGADDAPRVEKHILNNQPPPVADIVNLPDEVEALRLTVAALRTQLSEQVNMRFCVSLREYST
ncbi:Coiled-coil domain-containing protein 77 [Thoreauomyces humboldtii]|nr:Coiled-coil domain-containing protein 77 [Thoreauomyces humboldtii]